MGSKTGIEWTDSTWSPLRVRVRADAAQIARDKGYTSLVQIAEKMAGHVGPHCEHVSPGCENCYAETNNHRCLPANGTGLPYDRRSRDLVEAFIDEKALLLPLKWKPIFSDCWMCGAGPNDTCMHGSKVSPAGRMRPRRIFVENQSDIFGDWYTDEMLDRIFAVMALCQQHTFQVLTKRPERMLKYLTGRSRSMSTVAYVLDQANAILAGRATRDIRAVSWDHPAWPLPNVWLGVSVENQTAADERVPLLLRTPAAVRFLSCEPLLGGVDAWQYLGGNRNPIGAAYGGRGIDWVIAGGESGPSSRPMHPDWVRSLRDQCRSAGVPFHFKQWGETAPARLVHIDGCVDKTNGRYHWEADPKGTGRPRRIGKKKAGALLDGREWREFPEVRHA